MSKKTDLQVMQEMNAADTINGTSNLGICTEWRNANKAKKGATIEMCMPEEELYKIMNNERIPVLILLDKKEFFKLKNSDSGDAAERSVATNAQ